MPDWSQTAFVFPGQGAQIVGMGKDIAAAFSTAQAVFEEADDILGFKLSTLCFEGPEDSLNDTINTQPALFVYGLAVLRVVEQAFPNQRPAVVAGHSLGELTALVAAQALPFADGLRLVRERGRLMKAAGDETPGAMAAILGLSAEVVQEVCAEAQQQTGGVLVLANDNCPGQLVISGDSRTLDLGVSLATEAGAKRAVKLAVSIAAHSPLMEPSAVAFRQALAGLPFEVPVSPVYANVTAAPLTDAAQIRQELEQQLTGAVRWTESVNAMIEAGITRFVEFGPKDVLAGLVKRIDRSKSRVVLEDLGTLQHFLQAEL